MKLFFTILIALLSSLLANSQDLYDTLHTRQFASWLFKTGQYDFAAQEYERACFLLPGNSNLELLLLRSYRLSGNYPAGIRKMQELYTGGDLFSVSRDIATEYLKMLLLTGNSDTGRVGAANYTEQSKNFSSNDRLFFRLRIALLNRKWNDATGLIASNPPVPVKEYAELVSLADRHSMLKHKSYALAVGLSAMVPGAGKCYSGRWRDGLVSFLFVTVNAWQAYRGFDKYGVKSAYGWIFGTLSVGFYFGNIYGSYKAAKRYNVKAEDEYFQKTKDCIFSGF